MKTSARSKGKSFSIVDQVVFRFQNLEITRDALVIHFFEEKTIIPVKEIASYRFNWYLHNPIFAKKWWFLVLTVTLKNGKEESGHVTAVKFNYLGHDSELRKELQAKIARAIDTALSRASVAAKSDLSSATQREPYLAVHQGNKPK